MSKKQLFNNDWSFSKQPLDTGLEASLAADNWMAVTLPHDWLIYDSNNLYENGEGWYRKSLYMDKLSQETITSLYFEGVYMDSTLYVNGQAVGEWKYGYSSFEMDITSYLIQGNNEILVKRSEERRVGKECRSRWWP